MRLQKHSSNNIYNLSYQFTNYSVVNRIERIYSIFSPDEILFTSSFGTESAYLLHLVSRICPAQKVYFIDTGFHFKETLEYKETLKKHLNLRIVDVKPNLELHKQTKDDRLWVFDPDKCCKINKIDPVESIKGEFKVWLSGLKRSQSHLRNSINIFQNKDNIIKFHPLFDQSNDMISEYLNYFNLPKHPLVEKGYGSIGCSHCTTSGEGRNGRWKGFKKTECGLHFKI